MGVAWLIRMKSFLRERSLTLVLVGLFLFTMIGQILTGVREHNEDQRNHGQPEVGWGEYLATGHFVEATAENWESEFLQMGMYLVLTVFLIQKGSAESKEPEGDEAVDADPAKWADDPEAPWPVRKGGVVRWVYSHSLSFTFFTLFLLSFWVHAIGGAKEFSQDQTAHGGGAVSTLQYMATSRFWFESFQNWQSEFLSLAAMVYLSVYLREKGSPESKPVATPHHMGAEEWEQEQEEKGKLPTKEQKKQKKTHPGEDVESREPSRDHAWRVDKTRV